MFLNNDENVKRPNHCNDFASSINIRNRLTLSCIQKKKLTTTLDGQRSNEHERNKRPSF